MFKAEVCLINREKYVSFLTRLLINNNNKKKKKTLIPYTRKCNYFILLLKTLLSHWFVPEWQNKERKMDLLVHNTTYRPSTPLSCLQQSEKVARRAVAGQTLRALGGRSGWGHSQTAHCIKILCAASQGNLSNFQTGHKTDGSDIRCIMVIEVLDTAQSHQMSLGCLEPHTRLLGAE